MENRFDIGTRSYVLSRLSAFDAGDVARRYAMVLVAAANMKKEDGLETTSADRALLMISLSGRVPQADNDFVLNKCLSTVKVRLPGDAGLAPLLAPTGKLMYEDVSFAELYEIVARVMEFNGLVDFFFTKPATSATTQAA